MHISLSVLEYLLTRCWYLWKIWRKPDVRSHWQTLSHNAVSYIIQDMWRDDTTLIFSSFYLQSESVSQRPHLGKAKHTGCICIVVCHTIYTILVVLFWFIVTHIDDEHEKEYAWMHQFIKFTVITMILWKSAWQ